MLRSLVRGNIHPSDLQTEEELEEELPEDYFETVCKATEEGDLRRLLDHRHWAEQSTSTSNRSCRTPTAQNSGGQRQTP